MRTFSIGFPDLGFDESEHAAAVAAHLGTDAHGAHRNGRGDALEVVPALTEMYDEPFANSSQIPTHSCRALTRRHVTVALSGDGGDELFARLQSISRRSGVLVAGRRGFLPSLRRAASAALGSFRLKRSMALAYLLPRGLVPAQPATSWRSSRASLPLDGEGLYSGSSARCRIRLRMSLAAEREPGLVRPPPGWICLIGCDHRHATYLPDDILQKVDRASMAVALEARPPMLDHRVVEFAWRLPRRYRVRGGQTKWLLRRVLDRHVPRALIERPEDGLRRAARAIGCAAPCATGPTICCAPTVASLIPAAARTLWREHLSGRRNHAYQLWTLLTFEAWRRRWA